MQVVKLDRLILKVGNLTELQFERFLNKLHARKVLFKNADLVHSIGQSIKDYHHNLHIGKGEGAVYIGYKHNSSKEREFYNLKVEFNPEKFRDPVLNTDYKIMKKAIFDSLKELSNDILITGTDFAFDYAVPKDNIVPYSLTGRMQDRHKGTIYYGNRGKDGYLKIYDKKMELKQVHDREIDEEHLTRIEYSYRNSEGISIKDLEKTVFNISDSYKFAIFNDENLKGTLKACVMMYKMGYMDLKEFPRHTRDNIKKSLNDMNQLEIDHILKDDWKNILDIIKLFIL